MDQLILHSLKGGAKSKAPKPKHLKSFHAEEQHDGKYHVVRHSGNPKDAAVKHSAANLSEVQEALEQHMGQPNEGEQELGAGQPGMGAGGGSVVGGGDYHAVEES